MSPSRVDCSRSPNPVYLADIGSKKPGELMEMIPRLHRPSFETWLGDWLDGKNLWGEGR
jgi:hypothetical protein